VEAVDPAEVVAEAAGAKAAPLPRIRPRPAGEANRIRAARSFIFFWKLSPPTVAPRSFARVGYVPRSTASKTDKARSNGADVTPS
jgi:hypothetical protein